MHCTECRHDLALSIILVLYVELNIDRLDLSKYNVQKILVRCMLYIVDFTPKQIRSEALRHIVQ